MNILYTDLQKLVHDHCDAVVCVNGSMLAKDLRALLERNKNAPDYESMFMSACVALANIHEALGLDPDDAEGAGPIIEAIAEQSNTISSYMDINEAAGKENEMLKAEIAQLRAKINEATDIAISNNNARMEEIDQLRAELEQAKKDAAKYKWLMTDGPLTFKEVMQFMGSAPAHCIDWRVQMDMRAEQAYADLSTEKGKS